MNRTRSLADRLLDGDLPARASVQGLIKLKPNNLVERPWGGLRMLDYKGCAPLPEQKNLTGLGLGEAFETAACPSDPESDQYPSIATLPDGSEISLPSLLQCAGPEILGPAMFQAFHGEVPLLPKTLDIEELLSIQGHPAGNTELYIIISADPGASIRLGFRHNIDPEALRKELAGGRREQEHLLTLLRDDIDQNEMHRIIAPALADRDAPMDRAVAALAPWLSDASAAARVGDSLDKLKVVYWHVLDLMNEIAVRPGQVIYNATPARVCQSTGRPASAEVHALGNPERREILMLEIRRPGITFRAWDNVRFPLRDIDIDQTLVALNLGATSPEEFEITPLAIPNEPGVFRSVANEYFVVDHVRPARNKPVSMAGGYFHTLHAINGCASVIDGDGNITRLAQGTSAIAPATLDAYRVEASASAELIKVGLPLEPQR